jgi:hypothetical protein
VTITETPSSGWVTGGTRLPIAGDAVVSRGGTLRGADFKIGVVSYRGEHLDLVRPVSCYVVRHEDGIWEVGCSEVGIRGYGTDRVEALSEMHELFVLEYHRLAGRPDEDLTGDARRLRDALTGIIRS